MSAADRRDFLKGTGVGAAALALAGPAALKAAGANDRFVLGVIGCGGMCTGHVRQLAGLKDIRLAYLCDPDAKHLAAAAKVAEKGSGTSPKTVADLRQVLDDKAVDAVLIAT